MEKPYRSRRFTLGGRKKTPVIKIAQMQGNLLELVGNNPESQNWKGILIALVVIFVVIGIVALSVVLTAKEATLPSVPNLNLSDIVEQKWRIPQGVWVGKALIFEDLNGNIRKISRADGRLETIISKQTMKDNGITDYKISSNGRYALLAYNKYPIYTYSYHASYYVYDVRTGRKKPFIHDNTEAIFQYAGFGKVGSSMLYFFNGDLYYKSSMDDTESKRLTTGGISGTYHNGIADWIYEEKILKKTEAFWWSPNGHYLAYASFDDRKVPESYVVVYTKQCPSGVSRCEKKEKYRYPKVGYANPIVNIHIINMVTFEQSTFQAPAWNGRKMDIFNSVSWLGDDELLITWSNLTMTASVMQQCFATTRTCVDYVTSQYAESPNLKEHRQLGWLTNLDQKALPSGHPGVFFYIKASVSNGKRDFNHLALVNITKKPSVTEFLTSGNWEVSKLLHYDLSAKKVFYISNEEHSASRHVFSVDLNGNRQCVTCHMPMRYSSERRGMKDRKKEKLLLTSMPCQYYDATFGKSSEWFAAYCLGPGVPFSGTVRISNTTHLLSTFRILRPRNKVLKNLIQPTIQFENLRRKGGKSIKTKMLCPARVYNGKRPVVFFKGDVGSQTVDFRYQVDLASYIVKILGAFAIFVDGRGSGSRGNRLLYVSAGNPGTFEIEDMKEVLKFMSEKYPERVDAEKVAVVGTHGYGGYVAALSLSEPEFRCAVAISPITDWSLYDSFSSGRILGRVSKDSKLYQIHNLLNAIGEISGSQLKIFHSLQDRKIDMQHSVLLKQAAMLSDLPPDVVEVTFYTSASALDSSDAQKMEMKVYQSMSFFLKNCLFGNDDINPKS